MLEKKYMINTKRLNIIKFMSGLIGILCLTYFTYAPGLSGGFIFDDAINLENINVYNRFDGFEAIIRYILSYESGSLKRPITTISFLFNSSSWPADPYYFKLTNLILHLFNGGLLFVVSNKILLLLKINCNEAKIMAIVNMTIWLLHPFFVSTTLYVIQRMAMLPATFILLGFYIYLTGREIIINNKNKGRLLLFVSVYIFTILAVLSKENGVILPILLLILEYTLIANTNNHKLSKHEKLYLLTLPSTIIIAAFIYKIPSFISGYDIREFTAFERLLTQPRVIFTYLYHLFVPEYFTEGIYGDGFQVSKSLINPITTLYSFISLIFLLIGAILIKRRYPLLTFVILFYFTSHLIESSIIPLEIYFEHRNYLPALFLFLPLSVFLVKLTRKSKVYYIATVFIITTLAFTTHLRTNLWSSNFKIFMLTADKFPQSVRAVEAKAMILFSRGFSIEAIELLKQAMLVHDNISLRINLTNYKCSINKTSTKDFEELNHHIKNTKITKEDRGSLIVILKLLSNAQCTKHPYDTGYKLITAIMSNQGYQNIKIKNVIGYYEGLINLKMGQIEKSLQIFIKYIDEFEAFNDNIIAINHYIDLNELQAAKKLLIHMENLLKHKKYRYTKKDYIFELGKIKSKIEKINE